MNVFPLPSFPVFSLTIRTRYDQRWDAFLYCVSSLDSDFFHLTIVLVAALTSVPQGYSFYLLHQPETVFRCCFFVFAFVCACVYICMHVCVCTCANVISVDSSPVYFWLKCFQNKIYIGAISHGDEWACCNNPYLRCLLEGLHLQLNSKTIHQDLWGNKTGTDVQLISENPIFIDLIRKHWMKKAWKNASVLQTDSVSYGLTTYHSWSSIQ